jgi:hypothetical protein
MRRSRSAIGGDEQLVDLLDGQILDFRRDRPGAEVNMHMLPSRSSIDLAAN